MLYQIYETNRAWISPFSEFASAASKLYSNQLSPLAHMPQAQRIAAGFDLMHRLTKEYEKPEFGINKVTVQDTEVVVQEQIIEAKPFCRLIRFKRFTDDAKLLDKLRAQPSVLVVAPLSGHHSTLLRDTVRTLLQDHKVYIPTGSTRAWCRWKTAPSTSTTTSTTCRTSSARWALRCT